MLPWIYSQLGQRRAHMPTKQQMKNAAAIDQWFDRKVSSIIGADNNRYINRWISRHEFLTFCITMVIGAALSFLLLWLFVV